MEKKLIYFALALVAFNAEANHEVNIEYFSKTFTFTNVEIIQTVSDKPLYVTAKLVEGKKQIIFNGQDIRLKSDVVDLIICHELGHAEGEHPRRQARFEETEKLGDDGLSLFSSEGAADYFATYKCLKHLWLGQKAVIKRTDPVIENICADKFKSDESINICYRSIQAAIDFLNVKPWPQVSIHTPDLEVVNQTNTETYPSRQCRLDTFIAGALNKNRPACWYKENQYPLDSHCYSYSYQIDPPIEPRRVPSCRVVGETMYVDGLIDSNLLFELEVNFPFIKKLELNSYGGEVQSYQDETADLYKIANLIRQKGIQTNVRKGAKCASACTVLYMAGTKRTAHRDVKFLFHGLNNNRADFESYYKTQCIELGQLACEKELKEISDSMVQGTVELFKKYEQFGASPLLWERYKKFDEDPNWLNHANFFRKKDWVMTASEAKRLNVVQSYSFY